MNRQRQSLHADCSVKKSSSEQDKKEELAECVHV